MKGAVAAGHPLTARAGARILEEGGNAVDACIAAAACAVPGVLAGLGAAHRRYARLPWAELVAPAVEVARAGVELNAEQAFLHEILDVALRHEEEGRRIYGEEAPLCAGERLVMADLAGTLEWLAAPGADAFYRGELARRIGETARAGGGRITPDDLAAYRVIQRRPVRTRFRSFEFVSKPPPSSGGLLIAFALGTLDRLVPPPGRGGPGAPAPPPQGMAQ